MASDATPRPWKVRREDESIWIEGPEGSAPSDLLPMDRRIVCDFRLYGEADLDAETEANFALIVDAVNGARA